MKPTEILADFLIRTSFEEIPPEAFQRSKWAILDVIAVSFAGLQHEVGKTIVAFAKEMGGGLRQRSWGTVSEPLPPGRLTPMEPWPMPSITMISILRGTPYSPGFFRPLGSGGEDGGFGERDAPRLHIRGGGRVQTWAGHQQNPKSFLCPAQSEIEGWPDVGSKRRPLPRDYFLG